MQRKDQRLPLIDSQGAAERLGCSERLVRKLVHRNEIPYVRVGRLVRFDACALDRFIDDHTTPASGDTGAGT